MFFFYINKYKYTKGELLFLFKKGRGQMRNERKMSLCLISFFFFFKKKKGNIWEWEISTIYVKLRRQWERK